MKFTRDKPYLDCCVLLFLCDASCGVRAENLHRNGQDVHIVCVCVSQCAVFLACLRGSLLALISRF